MRAISRGLFVSLLPRDLFERKTPRASSAHSTRPVKPASTQGRTQMNELNMRGRPWKALGGFLAAEMRQRSGIKADPESLLILIKRNKGAESAEGLKRKDRSIPAAPPPAGDLLLEWRRPSGPSGSSPQSLQSDPIGPNNSRTVLSS